MGIAAVVLTCLFLIISFLNLLGIGGAATVGFGGLVFAGIGAGCLFIGIAPMVGGGTAILGTVGPCFLLLAVGSTMGAAVGIGSFTLCGMFIATGGGILTIMITILGIPIVITIAVVGGVVVITLAVGGTTIGTMTIGGALGTILVLIITTLLPPTGIPLI